jgi:putative chitinase
MKYQDLIDELTLMGIADATEQANILAQVEAESKGKPKSENMNYSAKRLLEVFPKYFKTLEDAQKVVDQGPEAIANVVYGGRMGNEAGEGHKYRGRGYIQITGKNNYKKYGDMIGVDLVADPEQANDPVIAKRLMAAYYADNGKGKDLKDIDTVTRITNPADKGTYKERKVLASSILKDITPGPTAPSEQGIATLRKDYNQAEQTAVLEKNAEASWRRAQERRSAEKASQLTEEQRTQIEGYRPPVFEVPPQFPQGDMPPGRMPFDVYQPEQQFSPFAQSMPPGRMPFDVYQPEQQFSPFAQSTPTKPVAEPIPTEQISVTAERMPYDMQEAARRSMMQGDQEARMADYEQAVFEAGQVSGRYPTGARSEVTTPQELLGGRPQPQYEAPAQYDMETLRKLFGPSPEKETMGRGMQQQAARSMGFAYGGMVPMQPQAQNLAALGRGGDSMMVHMQPREVAGLQQLAQANGTSLTTNPYTGQPEAFNLGGFLGAVAPIAAGAMFPGFGASLGLGSGIAAGALAGAGIAALSGGDILSGGLMGGLGGYGGGGLSGAASAAKQSAQGALTDAAANQAIQQQAIQQTGGQIASGLTGTTGEIGANLAQINSGAQMGASSAINPMAGASPNLAGRAFPNIQTAGVSPGATVGQSYSPNFDLLTSKNLTVPSAQFGTDYGMSDIAKNLGEGSTAMGYGKIGLTGLSPLAAATAPEPLSYDEMRAAERYDPNRSLNLSMDTGIGSALSRDTGLRLLAKGGRVQRYEDGGLTLNLNTGATEGDRETLLPRAPSTSNSFLFGRSQEEAPAPKYGFYDVSGRFVETEASAPDAQLYEASKETTAQQNQGGGAGAPQPFSGNQGGVDPATAIAALRAVQGSSAQQGAPYRSQTLSLSSLAGGGYLETGGVVGDGMSDNIPATIDGMQEARLSDGEFVLPADIVSHLGNGSSDAGAKQLYNMMDRIRKARTGTKKQGKEINAGRYMPA